MAHLEPKANSGWWTVAVFIVLTLVVAWGFHQERVDNHQQQKQLCELNNNIRVPTADYIKKQVAIYNELHRLGLIPRSTNPRLTDLQTQSENALRDLNRAYQAQPPANCVLAGNVPNEHVKTTTEGSDDGK